MKNQGFTLLEILVVVLVIGILAAISVPQYQKSVEKSRAAEVYNLLKNVKDAQNIYLVSTGKYAENLADLDLDFPYTVNQRNKYFLGGDFYWRICNDIACMYAGRKYKDGFYYIQVHFQNGGFVCAAQQNTQAKDICFALGFTEKYTTSSYIPWVDKDRNTADFYKQKNTPLLN